MTKRLITILLLSSFSLFAFAGDGAGLPSITECKYFMDQTVEVFHEELTGRNSYVYSTHQLRVLVHEDGWKLMDGIALLEDGTKYYAKVIPLNGDCFLSNFEPLSE